MACHSLCGRCNADDENAETEGDGNHAARKNHGDREEYGLCGGGGETNQVIPIYGRSDHCWANAFVRFTFLQVFPKDFLLNVDFMALCAKSGKFYSTQYYKKNKQKQHQTQQQGQQQQLKNSINHKVCKCQSFKTTGLPIADVNEE